MLGFVADGSTRMPSQWSLPRSATTSRVAGGPAARRIEGLSGDAAFELLSSVVRDPVDRRAGERIALETGQLARWVCADGRANEAGGPTDAGRRRAGARLLRAVELGYAAGYPSTAQEWLRKAEPWLQGQRERPGASA